MSHSPVVHGYLVLADISGYTAFLAQTELEHANEILTDLLETVLQRIKTLLTVHKIEGDCVFAHSSDAVIIRGETLLELIEATYIDFRQRTKNVRRHTTCTCRACTSIPMLDLKFMVHHGEYVVQNIGGARELAGSDVNLAHRLLKNHVTDATGWRAYVLLTAAALNQMDLELEGLVESTESYEHLGETRVMAMDLHARYEQLMERRRIVVDPARAFYTFSTIFNAPPPVVWTWLNDPQKRSLYTAGPRDLDFVPISRPGGRTGTGAITHCVHGQSISMREKVLDWKPFEYFTVEQDLSPMPVFQATFTLDALQADRTRLTVFQTGHLPKRPRWLGSLAARVLLKLFPFEKTVLKIKEVMEQEAASWPAGTASDA